MDGNEVLHTARLTLRRVRAEDWKDIREVWASVAKTEYARYDRPADLADEAVRSRIARWATFAHSSEHLFFAVCLAEYVIGYISLNRRGGAEYELGYCFCTDHHGKGCARESVSAALAEAKRLGARSVQAGTALENHPSVRLLAALGFERYGTEKVSFYRDEQGNDIVFDGGLYRLRL